jgi:hypothetical protein
VPRPTSEEYNRLKERIKHDGLEPTKPLVVNETSMVLIDGYTRLQIAEELGLEWVYVTFREFEEHLEEKRLRARQGLEPDREFGRMIYQEMKKSACIYMMQFALKLLKYSGWPDTACSLLSGVDRKLFPLMRAYEDRLDLLVDKIRLRPSYLPEIMEKARKLREKGKEDEARSVVTLGVITYLRNKWEKEDELERQSAREKEMLESHLGEEAAGLISASDTITVLGQTHYGKVLTIPVVLDEGSYTLTAGYCTTCLRGSLRISSSMIQVPVLLDFPLGFNYLFLTNPVLLQDAHERRPD